MSKLPKLLGDEVDVPKPRLLSPQPGTARSPRASLPGEASRAVFPASPLTEHPGDLSVCVRDRVTMRQKCACEDVCECARVQVRACERE